MKIFDNGKIRKVKSENYNYIYDYNTGFFARWGKTKNDDPWMAPFPEILDMEVTTIFDLLPRLKPWDSNAYCTAGAST